MLWTEVDLDAAVWRVPPERMKRKLEHEVPLSGEAVALLKRLEGPHRQVRLSRQQEQRACHQPSVWDLVKRLTGQGASPHGFRASFRSWCRAKKILDDVAERALAHGREDATQEANDREEMLEDRRKVMSDWVQFLSGDA